VPDLAGFAAANGHDGKTEDEIRAARELRKHVYLPIRPIRRVGSERLASFPVILDVRRVRLGVKPRRN